MTLTETQKESIRMHFLTELKGDYDKYDLDANIDSELSVSENINKIHDEIESVLSHEVDKAVAHNSKMEIEKNREQGQRIGLKEIFQGCQIVGMAGGKNSGKTNNLIYLLQEFRKTNKTTQIYVFGFPEILSNCLKALDIKEIDGLSQLSNKRDCIIIIEEMQKLKINDRRYKEIRDSFIDFIYHNNVFCILSSPNIREFNSVIGGSIERWLFKSISVDQCVNGSQLKEAVEKCDTFKVLGSLDVPKNKIILDNDKEKMVILCDYVEWADTKKNNKNLF